MFRKLGYYVFFLILIIIFGLSGLSDILSSRIIFIISGVVIIISLIVAIWLTITRKQLADINQNILSKPASVTITSIPKKKSAKRDKSAKPKIVSKQQHPKKYAKKGTKVK